jgi:UDP-glucose 4-epimerase
VFSSTCATYGFPDKIPITEDTPQRPVNPYGEAKLMFEKVLLWYEKIHKIQPVFLRYFNACGATGKFGEDHDPETHIIPNVIKVALKQQPHVNIFGDDYDTPDGTCIRDYIHILDLGRAHILALTGKATGPFNLGTGTGFSVREVIDVVRKVTKRDIPEVISPRRPGDPDRLVASALKAKKILKWTPRNSNLNDIIESAWAWHQAHPDGYKK